MLDPKNGVINDDDRVFLGSPYPDLSYGLNVGANYKGFDFSLFIQGVAGNSIYRGDAFGFESVNNPNNGLAFRINRWTEPNSTNDVRYPRVIWTDPNNNRRPSDRYLSDGSYLRLKNVQLGYTIPQAITESIGVSSLRLYVSAKNLITLTDYVGFDPEIGGEDISMTGIYGLDDWTIFPQSRTYLLGVNLSF